MSQDPWNRVEEIFHAALERPPNERAAYLDIACAGDAQLRAEVESLLHQSESSEDFMESPVGALPLLTKELHRPMTPGTRLGPYEVVAAIGAGGMGEVYRARDTRLGREVAIKVLLEGFSALPGRKERFEREARAVSALNHPHICTLYDIGNHEGVDFLVMEYIEGESLSSRLKKGSMPLKGALKCAVEIADALDKAHQQGIIHRDLKPGNIMMTKRGAKLLDFGLAKLRSDGMKERTGSPSESTLVTADGALMGTVDYMAPEVLQGKAADARTDIFALGLVLYEMVTGNRAFSGQTYPQVMAAILEREPAPVSQVSASTDRLIRKCMAKDPDERWQTAHDLRDELHWQLEFSSNEEKTRTGNRTTILAWSVAAIAVAAAILMATYPRETPVTPRFAFAVVPNEVLAYGGASEVALSPDQKHLAFAGAADQGRKMLWLRTLDSPAPRPLSGTENAWYPFWSADSRKIGFSAEGKLKAYSLDGNSVQVLADAPVFTQCDWAPGDAIVCGDFANGGLFLLSAAGGRAEPLTQLDKDAGELAHLFPQFLPGGDRILYYVNSSRPDERGVYVRSMQGKGRGERVLKTGRRAVFDDSGYLLEVQGEKLVAHPFDLQGLRTGPPVPVRDLEGVGTTARLYSSVSVSGNILAYGGADHRRVDLVMYDRKSGRRDPLNVSLPSQSRCTQVRLSPDEEWAALEILDLQTNTYDIWLLELGAGRISKFTTHPANERDPVFSPDGRRLAFTSDRDGVRDLYEKEIGAQQESPVLQSPDDKYLEDSPTTGSLVFRIREGFGGLFQLSGKKQVQLLPPADHRRDEFSLSPDRKWIAFNTEVSGNYEVKVASFPDLKNERAVSSGGGAVPRWRRDGEEIFYLSMSGDLMAARVSPSPNDGSLQIAAPGTLTRTRINVSGGRDQYAVSSDGQRFLLLETSPSETVPPITLVTNWQSLIQP